MALSTSATAPWTILSSRMRMPRGRLPPSALGMYVRRTGSGSIPAAIDPIAKLAEIIREPSFGGLHRHPPSTPGAALGAACRPSRRNARSSASAPTWCSSARESGLARPFGRIVHPDEMIWKISPTLCSALQLLVLAPHQSRPSLRSTRCLRRHPRYCASIRHPADQTRRLRSFLGVRALP
jgi:hypothetical protein